MARISLVEQYNNKDVLTQVYALKDSVGTYDESIAEAAAKADTAYSKASSVEGTASTALATAQGASQTAESALSDAGKALSDAAAAQADADSAVATAKIVTTSSGGSLVMTTVGSQQVTTEVPLASATQTGLMNAQTYASITSLGDRVSALENASAVVYVTFPSSSPTQTEIQSVFVAAAGRAPVKGDQATDIAKAITYQYDGSAWVLTKASAAPWSNTTAGIVKGTPATGAAGTIFAETDGTGSVNGWDALDTRVSNAQSAADANAQSIAVLNTSLATTDSNVSKNASDIAATANRVTALETTVTTIPKIQQATVTLSASSWTSSLTQAVSCSIVTASNIVWVAPATNVESYGKSGIYASAQADGTLTFTCASTPSDSYTVNIVTADI